MPETGIVRITDTLKYISKAFAFSKTNTEDDLRQTIGDIIEIMKDPPKQFLFFPYGDATKTKSTRLPTFCEEAQLRPACKIYCYPQC